MAVGPNALIQLADAKLYLHIDPLDLVEDALLEKLIDTGTARIEKWTKRKFKKRTFVERYDGPGTGNLILRQFPITDLTEVNIDPQQKFLPTTQITPLADFVVKSEEEGRISFISGVPFSNSKLPGAGLFPQGIKNVRISYEAGFDPIPEDVQLAAMKVVAIDFNRSREGGDGIASEAIGAHSITWIDGLPSEVVELLREYRLPGV